MPPRRTWPNWSILVAAEGAVPKEGTMELASGEIDQFGHVRLGGIGALLAEAVEVRTGYETRQTVLGHVQRGGTPTAFDRILATRFGISAIDAVLDGAFGQMVALQCGGIVRVPLSEAVGTLKTVDPALYHGVAEVFFAG
jgi:6-phosphofructokinase